MITYQDGTKERDLELKQNAKCLKYSDDEKALSLFIDKIKIKATNLNVIDSLHSEGYKSLKARISLMYKDREINFDFYFSHNDAINYEGKIKITVDYLDNKKQKTDFIKGRKDFNESLKYSILCDCKMNFYNPLCFSDFYNELGYNEDSIKDRDTFLSCLEHTSKIQSIFNENEIESLPN